jgi:hypothetical protein
MVRYVSDEDDEGQDKNDDAVAVGTDMEMWWE